MLNEKLTTFQLLHDISVILLNLLTYQNNFILSYTSINESADRLKERCLELVIPTILLHILYQNDSFKYLFISFANKFKR